MAQKRKNLPPRKRGPPGYVQKHVFLRLANYRYAAELPEKIIALLERERQRSDEKYSVGEPTRLEGSRLDIRYDNVLMRKSRRVTTEVPKDWQKLRTIENANKDAPSFSVTLAYNGKTTPFTLDQAREQGWCTAGHVERDPCPYGKPPEKRRYEFLKHSLIEKASIIIKYKRKGKLSTSTQTMWRLRQDPQSLISVYYEFQPSPDYRDVLAHRNFVSSPYWTEHIDTKAYLWMTHAQTLFEYLRHRFVFQEWPEGARGWLSFQLALSEIRKITEERPFTSEQIEAAIKRNHEDSEAFWRDVEMHSGHQLRKLHQGKEKPQASTRKRRNAAARHRSVTANSPISPSRNEGTSRTKFLKVLDSAEWRANE